jgi:hypothetical protein
LNPEFNNDEKFLNKILFEIISSLLNITSVSLTSIYKYENMIKKKNKKSSFIQDIIKLEFTGDIGQFEEECDKIFNSETYEYSSADFVNLFCIFHNLIYHIASTLGINDNQSTLTGLIFGWLSPYKWGKKGKKYSFDNFISEASNVLSVDLTSYKAMIELENWAKSRPATPENLYRHNLINTLNSQYNFCKNNNQYDLAIILLSHNETEFVIVDNKTSNQKLIIDGTTYKLNINYFNPIKSTTNQSEIFDRLSAINKSYGSDKKNKTFIETQFNNGFDKKLENFINFEFPNNINDEFKIQLSSTDEILQLINFMYIGRKFSTSDHNIQRIFVLLENSRNNANGLRSLYSLYIALGHILFRGVVLNQIQDRNATHAGYIAYRNRARDPLDENVYLYTYIIYVYNQLLIETHALNKLILDPRHQHNLQRNQTLHASYKHSIEVINHIYTDEVNDIKLKYDRSINVSNGFVKPAGTMIGHNNLDQITDKIKTIQVIIDYYQKIHNFITTGKSNISQYVNRHGILTQQHQYDMYKKEFDDYYKNNHFNFLKNAEITGFIFGLRYFWVIFKYTISIILPKKTILKIFTAEGLGNLMDELIGMIGGGIIGPSYLKKISSGTENPLADMADEKFDDKVDPILDDIINNIITKSPSHFQKESKQPYTIFDDTSDTTIQRELIRLGGGKNTDKSEDKIYITGKYKNNIIKSVLSTTKQNINKSSENRIKKDPLLRGSITGSIAANTMKSTFSDKIKDKIFYILCKLSLKAKDASSFITILMNLFLASIYLSSKLSEIVLEHYKLHRKNIKNEKIETICDYVSAHNRIIFKK